MSVNTQAEWDGWTATANNSIQTQVEDKSEAIDIRTLSVYDFMDHTYKGSGGYRDGTYLVPHPKEVFYNTRRKSSFYKNFFKQIVNAMVDPVFSHGVVRESDNDAFAGFIDNADNCGNSLHVVMHGAMTTARVHGLAFVVMDNFRGDALPVTEADASANRLYPYIYVMPPQAVKYHVVDRFGGLEEIVFFDEEVETGEGADKSKVKRYRKWDKENWYIVEYKDKQEIIIETGRHGLGIVPVIPIVDFTDAHRLEKCLPDPDLYDLAMLCYAKYNIDSELRSYSQTQTFSTLVLPNDGKPVVIGPSNYISVSSEAKTSPNYISPDSSHFVNFQGYAKGFEEIIVSLAGQNGVMGIKEAKSGIAKEWDFRAEEDLLKETAAAAVRTEQQIAALFGRYIGKPIYYTSTYADHFNPQADEDRIDTALKIIRETPPQQIMQALFVEIAERYFKGNEERLEEIKAAMQSAAPQPEERTNGGGMLMPPEMMDEEDGDE